MRLRFIDGPFGGSPVGLVLDLVLAFAHEFALVLPALTLEIFGVLEVGFAEVFQAFGTESLGHLLEAFGIFEQEFAGAFELSFVAHGDGATVGFVAEGFVHLDHHVAAGVLLDGALVEGVAKGALGFGVGVFAALHIEKGNIHLHDLFGLFGASDGDLDFKQEIFLLVAVELIEGSEDDIVADLSGAIKDTDRSDTGGASDGESDLLCNDGGDIAEFCAKDAIQIGCIAGKSVVSVAASGKLCHQIFVVSESDADGGDGDTFFGAGFTEATECVGRAWADVCESIRKQDDSIDALFVQKFTDFRKSFADSTKQGGESVGLDAIDLAEDIFFVGDFGCGDEDVDAGIVGYDGEDIVGLEHGHEHTGGLFGADDAFSAHRPRTVEYDGEIEWGALFGGGQKAAFDGDFQVHALVGLGADVRVADGDIKAQRWVFGFGVERCDVRQTYKEKDSEMSK